MIQCPRCKREVEGLTRDHVIPRWFARRLSSLGVSVPKFTWSRIQMICMMCNQLKGAKLEWRDPYVRQYVSLLIQILGDKLKETENDCTISDTIQG